MTDTNLFCNYIAARERAELHASEYKDHRLCRYCGKPWVPSKASVNAGITGHLTCYVTAQFMAQLAEYVHDLGAHRASAALKVHVDAINAWVRSHHNHAKLMRKIREKGDDPWAVHA